jgi:sigma-E factor negative regulatory protein RseB
MEQALRSRNYTGIFVHEQRGQTETLQIVHRARGAASDERLLSMDGSGREFVRRGGELTCYLPDQHLVVVEPAQEGGLLLANLRRLDVAASGQYSLRELAPTRVSGRDVRVLDVEPRDRYRYGYRLWIDASSAMPLKTQMRTPDGAVLEQMLFTDLRLLKQIADSDLAPQTDASGFRWARHAGSVVTPVSDARQASAWQASDLPPGFRMTLRAQQMMPGSSGPVTQWVFSDGLATVSVFIEQGSPAGSAATAPVTAAADERLRSGNGVTQLGSSTAYSTTVQGYRVTAIGEVPPDTVRAIAGSLTAPAGAAFSGGNGAAASGVSQGAIRAAGQSVGPGAGPGGGRR